MCQIVKTVGAKKQVECIFYVWKTSHLHFGKFVSCFTSIFYDFTIHLRQLGDIMSHLSIYLFANGDHIHTLGLHLWVIKSHRRSCLHDYTQIFLLSLIFHVHIFITYIILLYMLLSSKCNVSNLSLILVTLQVLDFFVASIWCDLLIICTRVTFFVLVRALFNFNNCNWNMKTS